MKLGLMLVTEDVYEGKLIPKGTTIFLGIWAMHHDEELYPNHEQFDPDRFLNHPKLASDYAASADYENRDKFLPYTPTHHFLPSFSPIIFNRPKLT